MTSCLPKIKPGELLLGVVEGKPNNSCSTRCLPGPTCARHQKSLCAYEFTNWSGGNIEGI